MVREVVLGNRREGAGIRAGTGGSEIICTRRESWWFHCETWRTSRVGVVWH